MKLSTKSPNKNLIKDDWNVHWKDYAESASDNPSQIMRHKLIINELKKETKKRQIRLLDIGSGQGDFLMIAKRELPNAKLLGFELSEKGVQITKQKVPSAEAITVDIFNPPPSIIKKYSDWATHAICSEVLEHVDDPVKFLKKSAPYLASNARIFITVPGGPMSKFDKHIGHRQHFTYSSLKEVLQKAGFETEWIHMAGFPFFNIYKLIVILRGNRLIEDVRKDKYKKGFGLANIILTIFRMLFSFNLANSSFGWQVIASAKPNGMRHH